MGRYATIKAPSGESINYKFWFGVQGSWMPWADDWASYCVYEYDETEEDITEEQKTLWQSLQEEELTECELSRHTEEEQEFIKEHSYVSGNAHDDDEDLAEYWDEIKEQAMELGVPVFRRRRHQDILETYETYSDILCDAAKTNKRHVELADLMLRTLLCCFLEKHGSYDASYEY